MATASASVRSADCARRPTSIWPIAGFAAWGSTVTFPIIRPFKEPPRTFSRERSSAQAVRDRGGALHEGTDRGRRSFRGRRQHHRGGRASTASVAKVEDLDPTSSRAVAEYLSVLDDAAFGGATPVEPKAISPTDPAARYTASANSVAGYAYSDNYLVDLKHAVIVDVEATTTIRQAEVGAAKTMLDRTAEQFDVTPSRLVADGGYGSADMVGWPVDERGIEPHVNLIDKSERTDGTFSRSDFAFDTERDLYVCPGGKELRKYRRAFSTPREGIGKDGAIRYRAAQHDCNACVLKPKCCPNMLARKIARSVHEAARDKARAIAKTDAYAVSCRERKKVEMLFAHLKRILRLGRLRLRGPNGADIGYYQDRRPVS